MAIASRRADTTTPVDTNAKGRPRTSRRQTGLRAAGAGEQDTGPLLRTSEVARRLQVSARTVLSWAQAGKLPSILTPGGHRRYPADGVERVLQAMAEAGEQRTDNRKERTDDRD